MATETPNLPEQLHQRPGNEVATRPYGGSDSESLDSGDILIPRMKLAQLSSSVVAHDLVGYGGVYVLQSRDDQEPQVMAPAPTKGELGKPVRFYIHGDPRKGWSWSDPNNELGRGQQYPSLALVKGNDPRNVRRTYDYLITLPDYPMLPVRFLMHGAWGGQSAKQLNTQILLNRQRGLDPSQTPFKLQVRKTSKKSADGQEQNYVQAVVGIDKVAAKQLAEDQELVLAHASLVGAGVQELDDSDVARTTATDAPSLD